MRWTRRLGCMLQIWLNRRARRMVLAAIDGFREDAWADAGVSREALRRDVIAYFTELQSGTCPHSTGGRRDASVTAWQESRRATIVKARSA
jgi:hypothetical protein